MIEQIRADNRYALIIGGTYLLLLFFKIPCRIFSGVLFTSVPELWQDAFMVGLTRKLTLGLWLCLAVGLFFGLGSPIFSESYGVHSHLLITDSDNDGDTQSHHTSTPDSCVYCHSWAGCALVLTVLPDKNLTERQWPPMLVSMPSVAFLWRTDDPVYSPSHPRGPPFFLLG